MSASFLSWRKAEMKLVIQRVKEASVTIDGELFSSISKGFLVFFGVEKTDSEDVLE